MPEFLPRKFIDLIHQACSKWVNWDAAIGVQVGAYGTVDKDTGELIVEGNIYDPAFQNELNKHNVGIQMSDFLPQDAPAEEDFIIASRGVTRSGVDNVDTPGVANAPVKGKWTFERGKRGAVLIMHGPRQVFIPPDVVLGHLYKVDCLMGKLLVTNIHMCHAYSMYLSDKSGEKVSLALVSRPMATADLQGPGSEGGFTWWVDGTQGLLRKASVEANTFPFTPLYSLKCPIRRNRRFFRDRIMPEPESDDLWIDDCPPWDPLDEDGEEDPFDPEIRAVDPFAAVDKAAAEKAAAEAAAAATTANTEA